MKVESVTPYGSGESKRAQIRRAFDGIARRYDRLNRVLSMGLDIGWRERALRHLADAPPARLLDIATGTADFALMAARLLPHAQVVGIDLSEGMLERARRKVADAGLSERITIRSGDGLSLDFPDAAFDAVCVAFGVRNFEQIVAGLKEMRRVLRPGGQAVILELSEPQAFPMRHLHHIYLRLVVPLVGRLLTGLASEYRYLPASVAQMPQGPEMLNLLREAGFCDCRLETYTFGACSCYTGFAPA